MVSSVTEGEDKPLKYPLMFRACELVIVNKIDLLEHLDFDMEKFDYHLDGVHPGVPRMLVSARTGEGIDAGPRLARRAHDQGGRAGVTAAADLLSRPHGGQSRVLRRRGGPHRAALPRDVGAVLAGGRLLAVGESPAARSDARHVAVEFVHPVIVGKRALPAVAFESAAEAALLAAARATW